MSNEHIKCSECKVYKKDSMTFSVCRGVGDGNIKHECKGCITEADRKK